MTFASKSSKKYSTYRYYMPFLDSGYKLHFSSLEKLETEILKYQYCHTINLDMFLARYNKQCGILVL